MNGIEGKLVAHVERQSSEIKAFRGRCMKAEDNSISWQNSRPEPQEVAPTGGQHASA